MILNFFKDEGVVNLSKSPRAVIRQTKKLCSTVLPNYSHRFSPKTFTLPQLFCCLVLKEFFRLDYRGVCEFLSDCDSICREIGIKKVPHFTTLQKAHARMIDDDQFQQLLDELVELAQQANVVKKKSSWAPLMEQV